MSHLLIAFAENFLCGENGVEGFRESDVRYALDENLDDFGRGNTDIECAVDVDFELWGTTADGQQRSYRDYLAFLEVECRTRVDVAECKLDDEFTDVRRDILKRFDNRFAVPAVDLHEFLTADFKFRFVHAVCLLSN